MSNGNVGVDVLVDEIDGCIEQLRAAPGEKQPTPLCGMHNESIVTLLRCEKHRLLRSRTYFRWGAVGSAVGGAVVVIIYVVDKLF